MLLVFGALVGLSTALVCPDGGVCEDRDTCCQNTAGGYGCCPLPHVSSSSQRAVSLPWCKDHSPSVDSRPPISQADCCSDHLHCCFEGTVCDLVHSKCVNKTVSRPLVTRLPARQPTSDPQVDSHLIVFPCWPLLWDGRGYLFVMFCYLWSRLTPKNVFWTFEQHESRFTALIDL